jgi:RNA polymerase sigma factor (sigma-70 family)
VHDPHAVEDLVQETLVRLLEARPRIKDDGLVAYAVVVARNLATTLGRTEDRQRRHLHRLVDPRTPPDPQEEALRREEEEAVSAALSKLSAREKTAVVGHELGGKSTAALAQELGSSPGGVAVQLARARAKLRVDYLLALKAAQPPSPVCRQVLVALSAGDRRRQTALAAGDHLLSCDHCATLSEPLMQRHRPLALMWPLAPLERLARAMGKRLQTPRAQATAATAAVAVAVGGTLVASNLGGGARPASPATQRSAAARPSSPEQRALVVAGRTLAPSAVSIRPFVGRRVRARPVTIESVPADEGFWIGSPQTRVFVRLTRAGESPVDATAGARVTFSGTIVRHGPRFADRMGVSGPEGAAELSRSRRHIEVAPGRLRQSSVSPG